MGARRATELSDGLSMAQEGSEGDEGMMKG